MRNLPVWLVSSVALRGCDGNEATHLVAGNTRQAVGTKPSKVTPWGEERRKRSGDNPTDRVNQQATRRLPSPRRPEELRVSTTGKVWAKA
jgi:hypothetical protein